MKMKIKINQKLNVLFCIIFLFIKKFEFSKKMLINFFHFFADRYDEIDFLNKKIRK